jgi:hypothetical protein
MNFLFLTRLIDDTPKPLAINADQIVALYPAVDFDHSGNATELDGTDIWTTMIDAQEGTCAWRVVEDYGMVTGMLADLRREA